MDTMVGVTIASRKDAMGSDDDDLSTLAEEKSIKYGSGIKDIKGVEVQTHARRASTSSAPTSPISPSRMSFARAPSPPETIAMDNLSGK